MPSFRIASSAALLLASTTLGAAGVRAQTGAIRPDNAPPVSPQSPPAAAADAPEIVVTAQRRAEASRDVPISVQTLSQAQLQTANVNSLADTAKLTPGLRFDSLGPAVQPTIRGVGTAITTSGGGPNVGIYVDGFFQSNTYVSDFQLLNVQNIQVLKGPQGTLFGRNTTGGAILVTTADPSTTTQAEVRANYQRFNAYTVQGYASTGLTERVAVDLEGIYAHGDGYFRNVIDNNRDIGRFENWSVRAGLKWKVTDDISVLLRYTHVDRNDPTPMLSNAYVDATGQAGFFSKVSPAGRAIYGRQSSQGLPLIYYYAPTGTYETRPGYVAETSRVSFRSKSDVAQATIKADLGFADLTSYTQYRHDKSPYYNDLDATALKFFDIIVTPVDETVSQEFVVTSKPGSKLQWTAGLNYFQVTDNWGIQAAFGGAPYIPYGGSGTNTTSYAAFADATYEVVPRLFLTVGARYSRDIVSDAYFNTNISTVSYQGADGRQVSTAGLPPQSRIDVPNLHNQAVTPRAVIRFKPSDESSVYASYTRGYKAGLLNVGGYSKLPVAPEKINAFEVGYKYDDRRFALDLAGYYYDYKNLQVSSFQDGSAQIRNAASSRIYGAEAQARYRLTSALNLNAGISWTHARYRSFPNAPFYSYCDPTAAAGNVLACGAIGPGSLVQPLTDASGGKMQRAPEITASGGFSYALDVARGRLTLSANGYYSSSFYFDPAQQFRQAPYATLALRAQWTDPSKRYTVAVYGDNVTGKRFRTQVLFNTLGIASVWNSPAVYGVQVGAKF